MSKPRLLLSYPFPEQCIDPYREQFDITRPDHKMTYEEVMEVLPDYDAFFTLHVHVDVPMLKAAPRVKAVANFGVGYDHIDAKGAATLGVPVLTTPTTVTQATAEHSVALIVDIMRGITRYDRNLRKGVWVDDPFLDTNKSIKGSSLGILGFGRIGKEVADQAVGLGMKVYYYDVFRAKPEVEEQYKVTYMPLEEIIGFVDCISINMPYLPENHHFVDKAFFEKMKPDAYFVNAARGPIVDEHALYDALKNNVIKGAGIDVFENEPYPLPELYDLENIVVTPHCASNPLTTRIGMCNEAMDGLSRFFKGEETYHIVNPEYKNYVKE